MTATRIRPWREKVERGGVRMRRLRGARPEHEFRLRDVPFPLAHGEGRRRIAHKDFVLLDLYHGALARLRDDGPGSVALPFGGDHL